MEKKYLNTLAGAILLVVLFLLFGLLKSVVTAYNIPFAATIFTFTLPLVMYFVLSLLQQRINHFNISNHLITNGQFVLPVLIGLSIGTIIFILIISIAVIGGTIQNIQFIPINKKTIEVFFAQLITATCEEFFFRGFLFLSLLIQSKKIVLSAFLSSIFFSLLHFQTYSIIDQWYIHIGIISAGMFFCYLYLIYRNLWIVISLHFISNFLSYVISWKQNVTGIDPTDKIQSVLMFFLCIGLSAFVIIREKSKKSLLEPFILIS